MKEVQELVGIVPWTFVAQICNLFLTVFLVKKFLFDRINKVVEERKQMADSQIADATKAKEEAKTMRDQYEASISNARIFRAVCLEYGSFFNLIRKFLDEYLSKTACAESGGTENAENIAEKAALSGIKIIHETGKSTNGLSDAISAELKKRGMKFMGSTIVYSFLQAIGVIFSHEEGCFLFGMER